MNLDAVKEELENVLEKDILKYNEPMKLHTSFKVGGAADILIIPRTAQQVIDAIKIFKKSSFPFFIIGNGSNLIVKDGGYRGAIIKLTSLEGVKVGGTKVIAAAGATLGNTAKEALKYSLKGMEFASGIPGTVGGAVTMNAGAYGGEIKDIIENATVIDQEGNILKLNKDGLELSYRHSVIQDKNYIVLEAEFQLEFGEHKEIKDRMDDLNRRRVEKQPLNYPSAGSTFKRPPDNFAGKLIENAGLKGFGIGGAKISEKHAGFVINFNDATAKDVLDLISEVRRIVNEKLGVMLEPEVKIIGED